MNELNKEAPLSNKPVLWTSPLPCAAWDYMHCCQLQHDMQG